MFILASRSPQRKKILEDLGVEFEVIPSSFDEVSVEEKDPIKRARILAEGKACVVSKDYPDRWVIGVDTLVVSEEGDLLEKPVDEDDARRMMRLHSGKTSQIHTALCLKKGSETHTDVSTAGVTFRELSDADIDGWISTGLWEDRSGAFQIEHIQQLIENIDGEMETIIGFPVELFKSVRNLIMR